MSNESFFDKVKDFITGHPEQADQGLDKAEEMLDERTGGQYTEQIAQGDDVVRERLGLPDDEATVPEPGDPPSVPGDPTPTPGTAPEPPTVPTPAVPTPAVPTPTEPTTTPPVPSPDPVPTSPPETVPEAAPDTTS
jgi:hypothetical protein